MSEEHYNSLIKNDRTRWDSSASPNLPAVPWGNSGKSQRVMGGHCTLMNEDLRKGAFPPQARIPVQDRDTNAVPHCFTGRIKKKNLSRAWSVIETHKSVQKNTSVRDRPGFHFQTYPPSRCSALGRLLSSCESRLPHCSNRNDA